MSCTSATLVQLIAITALLQHGSWVSLKSSFTPNDAAGDTWHKPDDTWGKEQAKSGNQTESTGFSEKHLGKKQLKQKTGNMLKAVYMHVSLHPSFLLAASASCFENQDNYFLGSDLLTFI